MPGAASEAPKSGLVHGEACDDRARAGRTGPKGEDFGEHGGSRIGVSFGTVLEAVVAACLRRKASEAVREGALAG